MTWLKSTIAELETVEWPLKKCQKDGVKPYKRCLVQTMSDEQIARLTVSEIIELIKRLTDELELRLMQLT